MRKKRKTLEVIGLYAMVAAMGLAQYSCESELPGKASTQLSQSRSMGRSPLIRSAKILNNPITLTGPVVVQIEAEDPEREAVSFRYQWYVNEIPLPGQTSATLPPDLLTRGQTVTVEIVPRDTSGQEGAVFRTAAVPVGNTPPTVTRVAIVPESVRLGERLEAQVEASDPDRDRTDLTYRWFRNDIMVKEGEEPFLDTKGFVARDSIVVEVTARDLSAGGNSLRSDRVVLRNNFPRIVSVPPEPRMLDRFEYTVKGVDPDGDPVTYQLETAPPGMTINEQSGQITWSIPPNQEGTFHIKILAKDGKGGEAYQDFDLTLSAPTLAKPAERDQS